MSKYKVKKQRLRGSHHPVVGEFDDLSKAKQEADKVATNTGPYGPNVIVTDGDSAIYEGEYKEEYKESDATDSDNGVSEAEKCSYCGNSVDSPGHPAPNVCDNV